jgi:acetyl-CoA carboxylase carboxyl transferase subunit alpha
LIDGIIPEPIGGAHTDQETTFKTVKQYILKALEELEPMKPEKRIDQRIAKFTSMGVFAED